MVELATVKGDIVFELAESFDVLCRDLLIIDIQMDVVGANERFT